jgi:hypothetical protein
MCRVDTESGSTLAEVLTDAEADSTPAGCVTEFTTDGDGLASLNGVAETPEYRWRTQVDGAPNSGPIGFGDLVFTRFAATVADPGPAPAVAVPALKPGPEPKRRGPRVGIHGRARREGEAISVVLRCPRGDGEGGCRGTLAVQFRGHRGGPLLDGGSAPFVVGSGERRALSVQASTALREALASRPRVKLRITAATRGEDGSVRLTHARRFVSG